jgi:hypothetical protein
VREKKGDLEQTKSGKRPYLKIPVNINRLFAEAQK